MFNRVDQLIDFEAFLQLRCTEMLLIHNSNGKLENVKAVVGQVAVRHSLHELGSLSDFKIEFRWKMIIDNINVQVLFSSPPSVIYFILLLNVHPSLLAEEFNGSTLFRPHRNSLIIF